MQDSYYNHILENIIHVLRNMKPMFGENMVEYQQLQVKDYDQIMPQAEALNSYNIGSKRNKLMEYFSKSLYLNLGEKILVCFFDFGISKV